MKSYDMLKELPKEDIIEELMNVDNYDYEELKDKNREQILALAEISRVDDKTENLFPKYGEIIGFVLFIFSIIEVIRGNWSSAFIVFIIAFLFYVISFIIHRRIINKKIRSLGENKKTT